jgi:hypothetical protein
VHSQGDFLKGGGKRQDSDEYAACYMPFYWLNNFSILNINSSETSVDID